MLNKVSDFKRIWDFVGRRNFSQEKLHFFFNDFFLFWFFFFFFFWLHHLAYRILLVQLGTEPKSYE